MIFKLASDHFLIVLSSAPIISSSWPFRFFNVWCEHPGLQSVVKEEWASNKGSVRSFGDHMKAIIKAIGKWQSDHFSSNKGQIHECKKPLRI